MRLKALTSVVLIVSASAVLMAVEAKMEYFTNVREVRLEDPARSSYFVVDAEVWTHAREDLGDLRLYSGALEVPYALQRMSASVDGPQHDVRILNLGKTRQETTFVLDLAGLEDYNEIKLDIDRKNYVTRATVEGADSNPSNQWTTLASGVLFDYSRERLGGNGKILLPLSTFRYLRVTIHGSVEPSEVKGASAGSNSSQSNASWQRHPVQPTVAAKDRNTVITFETPARLPIDRIHFDVPAEKTNFRRVVRIESRRPDEKQPEQEAVWRETATGEISRVLVRQRGGSETHESVDLAVHGTRAASWRVTIENGDDAPLPLRIEPQTVQRRVYFDPKGASSLKLYYGDEKLTAPVYDYAKFFRVRDAGDAQPATLGAGQRNSAYTGRPDDRPWSERHPWVVWVALGVAILGVGSLAIRGLKTA